MSPKSSRLFAVVSESPRLGFMLEAPLALNIVVILEEAYAKLRITIKSGCCARDSFITDVLCSVRDS